MKLSKRLKSCLEYTKGFNKLADIGTDHAQIPIEAITNNFVQTALAIDNKIGPFEIAKSNVKTRNLEKKITVILGDGLSKIDDDVDVVVISGMGGSLIAEILLNNDLKNVKRLILQMNNDANIVRQAINEIKYYIVDEQIIYDKNKFYDLIVLEQGASKYNDFQITFGPINLNRQSLLFIERIEIEISRLSKLINVVNSLERKKEIETDIKLLKEALK